MDKPILSMDAVIIAGGEGKRMGRDLPKALVEVKGKPILAWQIDYLLNSEIEKIVLAIGHKAEAIVDYIRNNYRGKQVDFTIEKKLLGTAGAVKLALQKCSSEFVLVLNSDDLTDISIKKLEEKRENTICVAHPSLHFGRVAEKDGYAVFEEKPMLNDWVCCGWYLLNRKEMLKILPDKGMLEYDVFPKIKLKYTILSSMKTIIQKIKSMKGKEKIAVLTAYDYSTAKAMDECRVDIILIGDSLGMVVLGYENTLSVTMEDMMRHTGAVARGTKNALIVADMPANSYNDKEMAALNAEALIKSGADTVKIENEPEIAKFLVENKIDVMGHIGLTPQTATNFKVQGKDKETADKLIRLAQELEKAGCYSLVLECVPSELAKKITESISIPTIGIGAGPYCDGQVLVSNDMVGLYDKLSPKFTKRYADLGKVMKTAFDNYIKDVKKGKFPEDKHSFH